MKFFCGCILAFLFISIAISRAEDAPVFTEADLQKYEGGGGAFQGRQSKLESTSEQVASQGTSVERRSRRDDRDYWCDKGREADNRLSSARAAYAQASTGKMEADAAYNSALFSRRVSAAAARSQASSTLSNASAALEEAALAKRDLEEDAHKNRVPAGWLRCQFE